MNILTMIQRILSIFYLPIKKMPTFFLFMYLLGTLCFFIEKQLPGMALPYEHRYLEMFLDLYLLCTILAFIPHKIRYWLKIFICFILYSIAIADVFCYLRFDTMLTPTILQLTRETNSEEADEFFVSYVTSDMFFSKMAFIELLLIIHATVGARHLYIKLLKVENQDKIHRIENTIFSYIHKFQPAAGTIAAFLVIWGTITCFPNKHNIYKLMSQSRMSEMERMWNKGYGNGLYLPAYRLMFSMYANKLSADRQEQLIDNIKYVHVDSCTFRSPNIILIIGESYNKHHSQLYGYDKATTPRQLRRALKGELAVFRDVITPWNLTSEVFKNVFSMHSVGDRGTWSDYSLFTELFKKAGYQVTFITNQFIMSPDEKPADFSGGFFLNNKELSEAQFDIRNTSNHRYDDGIISDYDSLKDTKAKHHLVILHLIGQHIGYGSRYPKDRQHFVPDDYDRPDLDDRETKMVSD